MSWPLAGSEASRSGDLTAEPVLRRPQTGRTSRMCHKPARAHGARAAEADSKARPDGSSGSLPPPKAAWSVRCGQNRGGCVLGTCRWEVVARTRTHGLGPLTLPAHPPCPTRPPRPLQPKRVTVPRRETSPVSRARLTRQPRPADGRHAGHVHAALGWVPLVQMIPAACFFFFAFFFLRFSRANDEWVN